MCEVQPSSSMEFYRNTCHTVRTVPNAETVGAAVNGDYICNRPPSRFRVWASSFALLYRVNLELRLGRCLLKLITFIFQLIRSARSLFSLRYQH